MPLAAALLAASAAAQVAIPPLKARVTDLTGTLGAGERAAIEQRLAAFESRKGAQIAVLIVPSTKPETVEQYAVRVEEAWKLGRRGVDDSVLLVVAKDDRRLRIEVGYGLEGVLPDAIAKRIIDEDIVPRFKQGDFSGGVRAGTERIMKVIEGEPLPAPRGGAGPPQGAPSFKWIVFILFAVAVLGNILNALFGRLLGSGLAAGAIGVLVWTVVGSLIAALGIAAVAFVLALAAGAPGRRGWSSHGGWSGGGWSSGGGSWSSGGGGGFSGGGGSSGGGGASGSW